MSSDRGIDLQMVDGGKVDNCRKHEGGTDGDLANVFWESLQEGRGIASSGHSQRRTGEPIVIPKREDGGFGEGERRSVSKAVPV